MHDVISIEQDKDCQQCQVRGMRSVQEGGACAAIKSLTLSKNRQNTWGLAE